MLSGVGKGGNMTKGKKILICVITAILVGACMCSRSPDAALRSSVFMRSPYSALHMKYEKQEVLDKRNTLYRITENEPVEKDTDGSLYTWTVISVGPLYFARYYGEY